MLDWLLGMHEVQGDVLSVKTKNYLKGKICMLRIGMDNDFTVQSY